MKYNLNFRAKMKEFIMRFSEQKIVFCRSVYYSVSKHLIINFQSQVCLKMYAVVNTCLNFRAFSQKAVI